MDTKTAGHGQVTQWSQLTASFRTAMPNPPSLSDSAYKAVFERLSSLSPANSQENISNSNSPVIDLRENTLDDMKDNTGAMGVIASKQEPKKNILNGSEHNNKQDSSPGDGSVPPPLGDKVISEVCSRSQLEVSPKQFLRINKLKAWIERKCTTVDETSPGVLKYRTPHFRSVQQVCHLSGQHLIQPATCKKQQQFRVCVCVSVCFDKREGQEYENSH